MKQTILYHSLAIFLMLSCNNPKKSNSKELLDTIAPLVSTDVTTSNERIDKYPDSTSELLDFKESMGKGVLSLNINPTNSDSITLYTNEKNDQEKMILKVKENQQGSWALDLGKNNGFLLEPFKHGTNFENFGFVWIGADENSNNEILLNHKGTSAWIKKQDITKCYFIKWEDYLKGSIFTLSSEAIYDQPISGSKQVETTTTSKGYHVLSVSENWIQVAPLDKSNPSQSTFKAVGWIKWFRDGEIQILVADDTVMEGYYYD